MLAMADDTFFGQEEGRRPRKSPLRVCVRVCEDKAAPRLRHQSWCWGCLLRHRELDDDDDLVSAVAAFGRMSRGSTYVISRGPGLRSLTTTS